MYSEGTENIMGNVVYVLMMRMGPTDLIINFTWLNLMDATDFTVLTRKNYRNERIKKYVKIKVKKKIFFWLLLIIVYKTSLSQSGFTCSKLTIETLEQSVKYVQN